MERAQTLGEGLLPLDPPTPDQVAEVILAAESLVHAAANGGSALENLMQPATEVPESSRAALAGFSDQEEGTS